MYNGGNLPKLSTLLLSMVTRTVTVLVIVISHDIARSGCLCDLNVTHMHPF